MNTMQGRFAFNRSIRLIFLLLLCSASFNLLAIKYKTTLTKGSYARHFELKLEGRGNKRSMSTPLQILPISDAAPFPSLSCPLDPIETLIAGVLQNNEPAHFKSYTHSVISLNQQNGLFLSGFLGTISLSNLATQLAELNDQTLFIPEFFGGHPVTFVQVVNIETVQVVQGVAFGVATQVGAIEVTATIDEQIFNLTIQVNFVGNELILTLFNGHSVDLGSIEEIPVAIAEFLPESYRMKSSKDGRTVDVLKDTFHRPVLSSGFGKKIPTPASGRGKKHELGASHPLKPIKTNLELFIRAQVNKTQYDNSLEYELIIPFEIGLYPSSMK